MSELKNNRVVQAFADLKAESKKTVVPFVTACWPDKAATVAMLLEFQKQGAKVCELGVPFSDPVADGPTIQASFTEALQAGVKVADVLDVIREYRAAGGTMGLLLMLSYSIVFRRGPEAFCAAVAEAGGDGLIVPDMPFDETHNLKATAEAAGLCNVQLIAPTTPPERREQIAQVASGFVYYISVAGITGARTELPPETAEAVAQIKAVTETPVCVGFGVSSPAVVETVCAAADGAIVGSAIVKAVCAGREEGLTGEALAEKIGHFVGQLLAPVK